MYEVCCLMCSSFFLFFFFEIVNFLDSIPVYYFRFSVCSLQALRAPRYYGVHDFNEQHVFYLIIFLICDEYMLILNYYCSLSLSTCFVLLIKFSTETVQCLSSHVVFNVMFFYLNFCPTKFSSQYSFTDLKGGTIEQEVCDMFLHYT